MVCFWSCGGSINGASMLVKMCNLGVWDVGVVVIASSLYWVVTTGWRERLLQSIVTCFFYLEVGR